MTGPRAVSLLRTLAPAVILLSAVAAAPGPGPVSARSPAAPVRSGLDLHLAPSLESEREAYARDIEAANTRVAAWFTRQGFAVSERELIGTAFVFDDAEAARAEVAKHFDVEVTSIPASFSGTVDGDTLYVVSREIYRSTFAALYPDWPWIDENYRGLIAHEVAHRAHAIIARREYGTEDAMGPRWFFEGLAILCAGNFDRPEQASLSRSEFADLVERDEREGLSYPIYARMIRFLSSAIPVRRLIEHARDPDFPENLLEGLGRSI